MAGHPLRPANDHSLGEPLPHQLANRARAPPSTPYGFHPCGSYAELASLSRGYSPLKGRLPTCYAPVRRAPVVLLQPRTRLACVKHAASVRSEPGSNSRLKLDAWAKKNALRLAPESQPAQANYCRSILLRPFGLEKPNGFERILAHRIGCQRARASCPAGKLPNNLMSIGRHRECVNTDFSNSHKFPQKNREEGDAA